MHWPLAPAALRPLVPDALEIDLFDDQAYVTLIPLQITESRPAGAPRALTSRFLETNLRTYVRSADGEPGIYFFSLDASSLLAVLAARLLYGLPYFPAAMSMRRDGSRIAYAYRRRGARDVGLEITWSVGDAAGTAAEGTLDHFLIERYSLYVARCRGVFRARVRHASYPLCQATVNRMSQTILTAAGLPMSTHAPLTHYSPGVDVDISWLERVSAD